MKAIKDFREPSSMALRCGSVVFILLTLQFCLSRVKHSHKLLECNSRQPSRIISLVRTRANSKPMMTVDRPAKDYASTRYSSLDQISAHNAKDLKLAFTFSTGMTRGHEAAPLVVNNTMYIVTPFPNSLYALDLTKPGAPMKWVYEPVPTPASQGVACCDVVNRGAAYETAKFITTRWTIKQSQKREHRPGSLENARWRHQQGREHDHGAARRQRESPRRQQRR